MWHLKYKDGRHMKYDSWGECQPTYARDFTQIAEVWQDGRKQTYEEQMEDIGR